MLVGPFTMDACVGFFLGVHLSFGECGGAVRSIYAKIDRPIYLDVYICKSTYTLYTYTHEFE